MSSTLKQSRRSLPRKTSPPPLSPRKHNNCNNNSNNKSTITEEKHNPSSPSNGGSIDPKLDWIMIRLVGLGVDLKTIKQVSQPAELNEDGWIQQLKDKNLAKSVYRVFQEEKHASSSLSTAPECDLHQQPVKFFCNSQQFICEECTETHEHHTIADHVKNDVMKKEWQQQMKSTMSSVTNHLRHIEGPLTVTTHKISELESSKTRSQSEVDAVAEGLIRDIRSAQENARHKIEKETSTLSQPLLLNQKKLEERKNKAQLVGRMLGKLSSDVDSNPIELHRHKLNTEKLFEGMKKEEDNDNKKSEELVHSVPLVSFLLPNKEPENWRKHLRDLFVDSVTIFRESVVCGRKCVAEGAGLKRAIIGGEIKNEFKIRLKDEEGKELMNKKKDGLAVVVAVGHPAKAENAASSVVVRLQMRGEGKSTDQFDDLNGTELEKADDGTIVVRYQPLDMKISQDEHKVELRVMIGGEEINGSPFSVVVVSPKKIIWKPEAKFAFKFGSKGSADDQFNGPWGVGVHELTGRIYVADYIGCRVQVFDRAGNFLTKLESEESGEAKFKHPSGLTVNQKSGNVLVADSGNHRVVVLAKDESKLLVIGSAGNQDGRFCLPQSVAVHELSGQIVVADTYNHRMQIFNAKGSFLHKFGSEGSEVGQFKFPRAVSIDQKDGTIIVADCSNNRFQLFTLKGEFVQSFGSEGSSPGQLNNPHGVALDYLSQNIIVADTENHRMQVFDRSGKFLSSFGSHGQADGQFYSPRGVCVDHSTGNIILTEIYNYRVSILSRQSK